MALILCRLNKKRDLWCLGVLTWMKTCTVNQQRKGHAASLVPKVKAGINKTKLLVQSQRSRAAPAGSVHGFRCDS